MIGPLEQWHEEVMLEAERLFTFDPSNVRGASNEARARFTYQASKRVARRRHRHIVLARMQLRMNKFFFSRVLRESMVLGLAATTPPTEFGF